MRIPEWWPTVLLALAAFRVTRLVGWDDLTAGYRKALRRRSSSAAAFVACPWCIGWWISLAWWGAWILWPHATLVCAAPWAISAIVGLVAKGLDP